MKKFKLTKQQKQKIKQVATWSGLGLATYEIYMAFVMRRQRTRDVFNLALQRKTATGKQLVVLGDPDGSFMSRVMGRDFDCADLCIDLRGCAACENVQVTAMLDGLNALSPNSAVIFVAPGQLESADDVQAALAALQRASGGDVFIAHVHPWTLASIFYKRRIKSAPPHSSFTEWRDLPWVPGPSEPRRYSLPASTQ